MSAEIDQKISDLRANLETVADLQDVAAKLFGEQAVVLVEKDQSVSVVSELFARGEEQRLVVGPTEINLNGED